VRLTGEISKLSFEIDRMLGEGTQGAVFRAAVGGEALALKVYFPSFLAIDVGLGARLRAMVMVGTPSNRFLWPLETVTGEPDRFGYAMPLRGEQYVQMTDVIAGRAEPTFFAMATAGFELADNFHNLHALGFSYQDISDRNIFMDPDSGRIEICDNDNVSVNGIPSAIAGTPDYMAPEIALGEIDAPNEGTDLHSLAILLFRMLTLHHPFLGARELRYPVLTVQAARTLFHEQPVFMFDPADESNHPVRGRHDLAERYWNIYPSYIRELFIEAFVNGTRDPAARVREQRWRDALLRMRDGIVVCAPCLSENFEDPAKSQQRCWNCDAILALPVHLRIGAQRVALNSTTRLFDHHVTAGKRYQFDDVRADIVAETHGHFGIRNLTKTTWRILSNGDDPVAVEPGGLVPIALGTTVDFGGITGSIER